MRNRIWGAVIAFMLGTTIAATVSTSATQQELFAVLIGIPLFFALLLGERMLTRREIKVQSLIWEAGFIWALLIVSGIIGIIVLYNLPTIPTTSHLDFYTGTGVTIVVFVIGYTWSHLRQGTHT